MNVEHADDLKKAIFGLHWKFIHLTEEYESQEHANLAEQARACGITDCPDSVTSIHVVDCIGKHEPINNTAIAERMELSKASITKISAKLVDHGFITRARMPDNKKEIYFHLTPKGKKLYELHDKMHRAGEERFNRFLSRYSGAELDFIRTFFEDAVNEVENAIQKEM